MEKEVTATGFRMTGTITGLKPIGVRSGRSLPSNYGDVGPVGRGGADTRPTRWEMTGRLGRGSDYDLLPGPAVLGNDSTEITTLHSGFARAAPGFFMELWLA